MAQSLCQIYIHLIFSTKNRSRDLSSGLHEALRAYAGGILRGLDCRSLALGCTEDHMHVLYLQDKNRLIPDVIMQVKKDASKWLKTQDPRLAGLHWQAGYGAFSVSASRIPAVKRYILEFLPPFQGGAPYANLIPGRCPGLLPVALSAQRKTPCPEKKAAALCLLKDRFSNSMPPRTHLFPGPEMTTKKAAAPGASSL
jgi:putative transposase